MTDKQKIAELEKRLKEAEELIGLTRPHFWSTNDFTKKWVCLSCFKEHSHASVIKHRKGCVNVRIMAIIDREFRAAKRKAKR